ncbi:hypothetical protein HD597_000551 [Nonomuraea thailandensis]|uniref:Uncharacterized protein n=1 Tax=Nonomuraea thailandensis TaxID=1188745 RepID=A0A9X2K1H2_9ACTN|nr:hypothetical protein [Nonomuraea thailandensis]
MTTDQPLTCSSCHGVITGVPAAAHTSARGRLIVTNGYCRGDCFPSEPLPADRGRAAGAPAPETASLSE